MKTFLKILLTLYIIFATACAGLFGYSYFSGKRIGFIDKTIEEVKNLKNEKETSEKTTDENEVVEGTMTVSEFELKMNNFGKLSDPQTQYVVSEKINDINYRKLNKYFDGDISFIYKSKDFVSYTGHSYSQYTYNGPEGTSPVAAAGYQERFYEDYNSCEYSGEIIPMLLQKGYNELFDQPVSLKYNDESYKTNYEFKSQVTLNNKIVILKDRQITSNTTSTSDVTTFKALIFDENNECKQIITASSVKIVGLSSFSSVVTYANGDVSSNSNTKSDEANYLVYKMYDVDTNTTYLLKGESEAVSNLKNEIEKEMDKFKNDTNYKIVELSELM